MRTSARLLLAGAWLLAACGGGETAEPEREAASPLSIGAVEARRESVVEPVFGTGTIAAHKTTEIGPRVDGIIEEIHVRVGDRVEAGDPLFRTREVDYRIRLQEAEYARRLARAEAEKTERDERRIETLHARGVASEERLDEVRTADEMAAARVGAAETALARARQELEDTLVRAPYRGVITRRYVDEGAMMRTMMSSNSPVVQIMKTDVVVAIVQIPEVQLPRVSVGTRARVGVDGTGGVYDGEVAVLNDRVDPVSRAFEVRIPIANPELVIKPGLFCRAEIFPEARDALVLERRAVLGSERDRFVYMAEDGKASRRPIGARELDATRVEVTSGLEPGDLVLAGPNLPRVREGTPVAVEVAHADR